MYAGLFGSGMNTFIERMREREREKEKKRMVEKGKSFRDNPGREWKQKHQSADASRSLFATLRHVKGSPQSFLLERKNNHE